MIKRVLISYTSGTQYDDVRTRSIFSKILTIDTRQTTVIAVLCIIACYIGPRYNGTRLYKGSSFWAETSHGVSMSNEYPLWSYPLTILLPCSGVTIIHMIYVISHPPGTNWCYQKAGPDMALWAQSLRVHFITAKRLHWYKAKNKAILRIVN